MTIFLHHNFSGRDLTVDITELDVYGNYYSFDLDLPQDSPFGEYSYKICEDSSCGNILSSGIINYSPYMINKYVVRDNVVYTVYDQN